MTTGDSYFLELMEEQNLSDIGLVMDEEQGNHPENQDHQRQPASAAGG